MQEKAIILQNKLKQKKSFLSSFFVVPPGLEPGTL